MRYRACSQRTPRRKPGAAVPARASGLPGAAADVFAHHHPCPRHNPRRLTGHELGGGGGGVLPLTLRQ
eukprot:15807748-Heterocapsa_arctica.AAC.1